MNEMEPIRDSAAAGETSSLSTVVCRVGETLERLAAAQEAREDRLQSLDVALASIRANRDELLARLPHPGDDLAWAKTVVAVVTASGQAQRRAARDLYAPKKGE